MCLRVKLTKLYLVALLSSFQGHLPAKIFFFLYTGLCAGEVLADSVEHVAFDPVFVHFQLPIIFPNLAKAFSRSDQTALVNVSWSASSNFLSKSCQRLSPGQSRLLWSTFLGVCLPVSCECKSPGLWQICVI